MRCSEFLGISGVVGIVAILGCTEGPKFHPDAGGGSQDKGSGGAISTGEGGQGGARNGGGGGVTGTGGMMPPGGAAASTGAMGSGGTGSGGTVDRGGGAPHGSGGTGGSTGLGGTGLTDAGGTSGGPPPGNGSGGLSGSTGSGGTAADGSGGSAVSGSGGSAVGGAGGSAGVGGSGGGGRNGTTNGGGGVPGGIGGRGAAPGMGGNSSTGPGGAGGSPSPGSGSGGYVPLPRMSMTGRTAADSTSPKQVDTTCPSGSFVLGAGWSETKSDMSVLKGRIGAFHPEYDGTGWLVNGDPAGVSTDWSLNLQLICGAPPGYKVVTMESPVDGTASKSVTASCPAGTKSLSAGWSVLDGTGAFLDGEALQLRMDDAGTSWTVKAVNRSTFATSYKVLLRVMCAASEGLTGYQIVKLSSAAATGPADLQVSCPSGKSPVFAGWTVLNGSGAPVDGRLAYSIAGVSDWKLGAAPVDSNSASLEARVICLD